jgi:hypothetical protein
MKIIGDEEMKKSLMYFINRNIRNLIIALSIMLVLAAIYIESAIPTIINMAFAPFELNYQNAFVDENLITLQGVSDKEESDSEVYSNLEQNNYQAQNTIDFQNVYKQNNRYKFVIRPKEVYDIDLAYDTTYTLSSGPSKVSSKPVGTHKYVLLDTGKALVLTKVSQDFIIKPNQEYKGMFLSLPKVVINDLQKGLGEGYQIENLFCYELNTLASRSFYEKNDMLLLSILIIIILIIVIKLIFYIVDYKYHPTFKQFRRLYGSPKEIHEQIDSELADEANVIVSKNTYTTKQWKITKGIFKTKISMVARRSRFDS